ncbi:hypothetical protein FSS13T_19120 [Flavobacterium saliperosum S13]|uniref:Uncharacterized protein n=1 Tax=Flavobacterium saliperosum S13 TaxID=1341155 RepID=A0ABN0QFE7_9FLAO|nr:hypothetical protein FSS13T_19120 [Flavobacterium saliperosum S13]
MKKQNGKSNLKDIFIPLASEPIIILWIRNKSRKFCDFSKNLTLKSSVKK